MRRIIVDTKQVVKKVVVKPPIESKRARCPFCNRRYTRWHALNCGHPGYCSLRCSKGLPPNTKKKLSELKRREKQLNRQVVGFYETREWRDLRFKILRKYGFVCMACGNRPPKCVLHVDHIKPRSLYPQLELDPENLQVLCEDCNLGKGNKSEDDLRPTT